MVRDRRVLLKLSGEVFLGKGTVAGVTSESVCAVAEQLSLVHKEGYQLGVVLGGGNFFRGVSQGKALGMERTPADQIGMLSTIINGLALKSALTQLGVAVRMVSALPCPQVVESYCWERVMEYLAQGILVLFVGGTGHPYFTTDTNAALRACETKSDLLVKATTHVDYAYDKDPLTHPDATPYTALTFQEVLEKRLGVMDLAAVALCMQAQIPIQLFNFHKIPLLEAISKRACGTRITG